MTNILRKDRILLQRRQLADLARKGAPTYQHAHALVAKVAKACANEYYEMQATYNSFYDHYPDRDAFVSKEWHNFIVAARNCLARQLQDPRLPDAAKEEIFEALALDRELPRPDNVFVRT